MIQLYLLRHGIAVPSGTPGIADDDRPLTSQGERRMREIGRGLRALGIKLDRIVSSPVPRGIRTAEIVAGALDMRDILETSDALRPERGAATIRDWIGTRSEDRLMIVGHNPAFSELPNLLVGAEPGVSICELRKGGVAAFTPRVNGGMALDWLARPRLLRRLRD
jgi:phosphohistidine phosphatase